MLTIVQYLLAIFIFWDTIDAIYYYNTIVISIALLLNSLVLISITKTLVIVTDCGFINFSISVIKHVFLPMQCDNKTNTLKMDEIK